MSYVLTTNWDEIQDRNIDPFSPVHSDNHNKLLKILGTDKLYIDGLDCGFEHDYENGLTIMQLSPGIVVFDYVCIEFKEISSIVFLNEDENINNEDYYVVVEYEFRKIKPLSVASIKTIKQSFYDPSKHLILYEFHTPAWDSIPDENTFNTWVTNTTDNFIDKRTSIEYLPAWLSRTFLSTEGEIGVSFFVPTPTLPDQIANKKYVDNLIANHDEEHMDYYVSLLGSTMTGKLYLSEHPDNSQTDPMGSVQAATKGYVDYWANFLLTEVGNGYPFLPLSGGTMTGFLTLPGAPVNDLHAATKLYVDNRIENRISDTVSFTEETYLPLSGGTMTGSLVLYGDPLSANQAANKAYVDNKVEDRISDIMDFSSNTYLPLSGGTMTGFLTLPGSPTNSLHAATKSYVDTRVQNVIDFSGDTYLPITQYTASNILSKLLTVDGTGSGLDADLLDGKNSSEFAAANHSHSQYVLVSDYDNADVLAKVKGVDGSGSGLDADLLDGQHASAFATAAHNHDSTYLKLTGGTITGNLRITGTGKLDGYFYGGTVAPTNATRLNYDGYFYATKVYNAVYNDYADSFDLEDGLNSHDIFYKIMAINDNEKAIPADENSEIILGVASNMYAFLAGASNDDIENNKKIPISIAGFVNVKIHEDFINECAKGKFVVPFKDGFGKTILKSEISNYIGKIVGEIIKLNEDGTCMIKVMNL